MMLENKGLNPCTCSRCREFYIQPIAFVNLGLLKTGQKKKKLTKEDKKPNQSGFVSSKVEFLFYDGRQPEGKFDWFVLASPKEFNYLGERIP